MRFQVPVDADDCGCAPTQAELTGGRVTRRVAIAFGALGVMGVGALLASPAWAADYPSWDDVQRAKANEQSKAAEVTRIEAAIAQLAQDVLDKQAIAEQLGREYAVAQEAFEIAADRAESLQAQADAEEQRAAEAAQKLGRLAAVQYQRGGGDTSLELFFSDSAAGADDLLARLGTMDKLMAANHSVYTEAVAARDNARNLSDQATIARDERDRLKQEAEAKMIQAQEAASAAQAALDAQQEHLGTLQAQLSALKDQTAKTIADYQAGVEAERKAREERLRREREAAAAAAAAAAAEAAANGGSGAGGGIVQSSGWVRPANGGITSWFGTRGTICANGYCTTGHRGIDFGCGCGAAIYAAAGGTVVFAGKSGAWGNYIKVDHGGGIVTGYAHIRDGGYNVGYGQHVGAGQIIAYAGNTGVSTGCHLHFEVYSGGERIDPAPYLRARGISV